MESDVEDEEDYEGGEDDMDEDNYMEASEPGPSTPKKRKRRSSNSEKSNKRARGRGRGRGKGKGKARDEQEDDEEVVPEEDEEVYLPEESPISARPEAPTVDAPPPSAGPRQVSMDDMFIFDQRQIHAQAQHLQGGLPLEYFEDPPYASGPAMNAPVNDSPVARPRPIPAHKPNVVSPPHSAVSDALGPFTSNPLQVVRGRKTRKTKKS